MAAIAEEGRPVFGIRGLAAVSPSLAELLRACPLRAALTRLRELRAFVLGNPKAWLGIAYHDVLEKLWSPSNDNLNGSHLIERLWSDAIAALSARATSHPLNCRFSEPEKWPGYHLSHACVLVRGRQALEERQSEPRSPGKGGTPSRPLRERRLSAMGGRLIGKPDVIAGDEILDYKSGRLHEQADDGQQVLKEEYLRQLRIYGYLVHQCCGLSPVKGKLLPMQGESVEVHLDPDACAAEANEAILLLEAFNARLNEAQAVQDLATPSPRACRWCQFKAVCPAFWDHVDATWVEELYSAAVRGVLLSAPALIHDGRAYSTEVRVSAGTACATTTTIAPLDRRIHPYLADFRGLEEARFVNLFARRDGQLRPISSTLCFRDAICPAFRIVREGS